MHFDALHWIFDAPAASNSEIEYRADVAKKGVVNARARALQLLLDFRSGHFAREPIMQRGKTRHCATERGQVSGGPIALRFNESVEHRFEGDASFACTPPVKHLLNYFEQTDSRSV